MNLKPQIQSQNPGGGARLHVGISATRDECEKLGAQLRSVSEHARKLLAQIIELAYHGRGQQRKPDVAYLPELYESCGLGVEAMYPLLDELQGAGLIEIEDRYPFEDVKIPVTPSGENVLAEISRFCESEKIPLRDVIVDLRFELLQ